jgi:hypothetical protein
MEENDRRIKLNKGTFKRPLCIPLPVWEPTYFDGCRDYLVMNEMRDSCASRSGYGKREHVCIQFQIEFAWNGRRKNTETLMMITGALIKS